MIKARGGTLLWTGDAKAVALGPQDGNQWDYLALVYYPSVAAFIDMMTSDDYEKRCDPHRTNGCAEHVIIATKEAYSKFKAGVRLRTRDQHPGSSCPAKAGHPGRGFSAQSPASGILGHPLSRVTTVYALRIWCLKTSLPDPA